ncbi:hypothetical protein [Mesorhizobium sp. Root157]|uniref:hypothetical protein n=1 Tax=Mesorhizobium sp. Root157 TaxID=1736477 RepID=UPI000B089838|nr:hypothetical protein [Mesorhizobium sp. Root157]
MNADGGAKTTELAAIFGVSYPTIKDITKMRSWLHLPPVRMSKARIEEIVNYARAA